MGKSRAKGGKAKPAPARNHPARKLGQQKVITFADLKWRSRGAKGRQTVLNSYLAYLRWMPKPILLNGDSLGEATESISEAEYMTDCELAGWAPETPRDESDSEPFDDDLLALL